MIDRLTQQQLRIHNLKRLGISASNTSELTRRLGGREVYWKNLVGGLEPFGDISARRIELAFGLPDGSLDQIEEFTQAIIRSQEAQRAAPPRRRKRRAAAATLQGIAQAAYA